MKVEIKDKKKLLHRLFLYRSILFKFVSFKTSLEDDEVKDIVNALNIKKKRERIAFIYDRCCFILDNQFKDINICGFNCNKCYTQRKTNYINGCCRMCLYQSNEGCKTSNLTCKLFYCSEVKKRYNVLSFNDLKLLKLLNIRRQYIVKNDYFSKREDVLKDLYSISFIYAFFRIYIRFIKNITLLKINS